MNKIFMVVGLLVITTLVLCFYCPHEHEPAANEDIYTITRCIEGDRLMISDHGGKVQILSLGECTGDEDE